MAGTIDGGKQACRTNRQRHGDDFYARIGAIGGASGNTGGFASEKVDSNGLTGKKRARIYGAVGGRKSRRNNKVAA